MRQEQQKSRRSAALAAGGIVFILAIIGIWMLSGRTAGTGPGGDGETAAQLTVTDGDIYIEGKPISGRYLEDVDFEELQKLNPDICGWIWIPGTAVDYPIVQAKDNDTYMRIGIDGDPQTAGSIFLDYESDTDFKGKHNILYGHNMKNGTMFHDVVRFKDEDYFKKHQYAVVFTPQEAVYLKMVSAYYGQALPVYRKTQFASAEDFQIFYEEMLAPCGYAETSESPPDELYTLITCSYEFDDARTYLHGVRTTREEAEEAWGFEGKGEEGV